MPSLRHEALVELFRHRPALAAELLRDALGVKVPAFTEARIGSENLTQVVPTEYRADLVVLLQEGEPVFAIVVEVQLSQDERKRRAWPAYIVNLWSRLRCPTELLVVTPDAAVARWSRQPIEAGARGFVFRPHVAGPERIPIVTRPEAVRQAVELAVLSAMAHGQGAHGEAIAQAVVPELVGVDAERSRLYLDLVMCSLNGAARSAMEALMQSGTYEYQSEFARRYVTEGLVKGRQEGRQEEGASALLAVLDARGLRVDQQARERITSCTDLEQLHRWLRKSVSIHSVDELFES